MKKIVRLTESELKNIVETSVRRAIKEGAVNEGWGKDLAKVAGAGALGAAGMVGMAGAGAYDDQFEPKPTPSELGIKQAVSDEFGSPQGKPLPKDTIGWEEANRIPESRIRRAVMESIKNLMNEGDGTDKLADRERSFKRMAHLNPEPDDKKDKEYLRMRKGYIKNQRKNG